MNILIICKNSGKSYSGGRYLSWIMAEALLRCGHDVTYATNSVPMFVDDFKPERPKAKVIRILCSPFAAIIPNQPRFDFVIVFPHLLSRRRPGFDYLFYNSALSATNRHQARLVLMNFESPNWINEMSPQKKNISLFKYWIKTASRSSLILSNSEEGSKYARLFYSDYNSSLSYATAHPAINSDACDESGLGEKEDRLILISRFTDVHKNGRKILDLIGPHLKGFTLEVIIGTGSVPPDLLASLHEQCNENGVKLEIQEKIPDIKKFSDLKKARLLIYPSLFEGYGYPPIEAQYSGTPVLAFDLPVLREVSKNGIAIRYAPLGDYGAMRSRCQELLDARFDAWAIRESIAEVARLENYGKRLDEILKRL